ncbi:unnamed protein product [Prunus armeniaca]
MILPFMFTVVLIGSIVGFSGAALGSVGGVGGGGNACLDHWFDPKSSTAISKCMIMGAAANAHAGHQHRSSLQRHVRQLDGHSSTYHSLLSYSSKSFNEGHRNMEERDNDEEGSRKAVGIRVQTFRFLRLNYCICEEERTYDVDGWLAAWKIVLSCADGSGEDYKLLPSGPASLPDEQVPISHNDDNVYWKELWMIVYVWVAFLIVQIVKSPLRSLKPSSYAKDQGDCVQRKGNHKLEVASDFSVLQLWDSSWYDNGCFSFTVYFNLRLRHPTLDMPLIDYDLAFLFQPMIMLGISIGVAFNVMFADWMVTVLLIILFLGNNILTTIS